MHADDSEGYSFVRRDEEHSADMRDAARTASLEPTVALGDVVFHQSASHDGPVILLAPPGADGLTNVMDLFGEKMTVPMDEVFSDDGCTVVGMDDDHEDEDEDEDEVEAAADAEDYEAEEEHEIALRPGDTLTLKIGHQRKAYSDLPTTNPEILQKLTFLRDIAENALPLLAKDITDVLSDLEDEVGDEDLMDDMDEMDEEPVDDMDQEDLMGKEPMDEDLMDEDEFEGEFEEPLDEEPMDEDFMAHAASNLAKSAVRKKKSPGFPDYEVASPEGPLHGPDASMVLAWHAGNALGISADVANKLEVLVEFLQNMRPMSSMHVRPSAERPPSLSQDEYFGPDDTQYWGHGIPNKDWRYDVVKQLEEAFHHVIDDIGVLLWASGDELAQERRPQYESERTMLDNARRDLTGLSLAEATKQIAKDIGIVMAVRSVLGQAMDAIENKRLKLVSEQTLGSIINSLIPAYTARWTNRLTIKRGGGTRISFSEGFGESQY
jgi:hypothetical protein